MKTVKGPGIWKGAALYKYDSEWTLEISRDHPIPEHKGQMYVYHTPDPNGPWECHLGGRWVHGSTADVCNCGVKFPKTLYSRIRILDEIRKKNVEL